MMRYLVGAFHVLAPFILPRNEENAIRFVGRDAAKVIDVVIDKEFVAGPDLIDMLVSVRVYW